MKTLKEILSFTKTKEQNASKKAGSRKLFSPASFLCLLTCLITLGSCIVREGRPRHHRHHREVIVVEHR